MTFIVFGQAFLTAWTGACTSTSPSVFLVPEGRKYLVKPLNFKGPCTARNLTALVFYNQHVFIGD